MFCPKCGATLKPNARFCTKCGYKLKTPVPPAEEIPAYEADEPVDLHEPDPSDGADYTYEPDVTDEAYDSYEADIPAVPSRPVRRETGPSRGTGSKERAKSGKGMKPVLVIIPLVAVLAAVLFFGRNLIGNKSQKAERAGSMQQEKASGLSEKEAVEETKAQADARENAAAEATEETAPPEVIENIEQQEDELSSEKEEAGEESSKKTPDAEKRYEGWLEEEGGWRYYNGDGSYQMDGWLEDADHRWYYFDADGYMLADTLTPDGFRVGPDGAMITESQTAAQPAAANTPAFGTGTALPSSGTASASAGDARTTDGFVIPDSSTRYISGSELQGFSEWEARAARNEIYARHGRRFNSDELQKWFDAQDWYKGTVSPNSFNESVLSAVEKANIKTIESYEKRF